MNPDLIKRFFGFSLALDIIILDQLSKWVILELFLRPEAAPGTPGLGLIEWLAAAPERLGPVRIEVTSFFNLVMVWNQGISFGLFQSGSEAAMWAMISVALAITAFFSVWLARTDRWLPAVALGMVIGGAIGNVIDRLRFGAVADFLDFHVMGFHWPAFNLADACITVGIALVIIDGLFFAPAREEARKHA